MKNDNKILISFDIEDIATFINILKTFSKITSETPWIFNKKDGIIIKCVADNKTSYATLTIEEKYIINYIFNYNEKNDDYYIVVNFENLLNLLNFAVGSDKITLYLLSKNPNILNIKVFKNNINTKNLKLNLYDHKLNYSDNNKKNNSIDKIIEFDYRITSNDSVKFNKYLKDMEKISPYISFLCSDDNFIIDCLGDNNSQVTINYTKNLDNNSDNQDSSNNSDTVKITKLNSSLSKSFKNYYQICDIIHYSNCSTCSSDIRLFIKNNDLLKIVYQIYNKDNKDKEKDKEKNSNVNKFATLRILINNIDPEHFNTSDNNNNDNDNDNLSEYSDSESE